MQITAAVARAKEAPLSLEEISLAEPRPDEVLVRLVAAGICHTDISMRDHLIYPVPHPVVLGHEGAAIIEEVGPGVTRVKPGDHVVLSFIPNCGICRYCATGRQSICDMGATILEGYLPGGRFPITGPRGEYGHVRLLVEPTDRGGGYVYENRAPVGDIPSEHAPAVEAGVTEAVERGVLVGQPMTDLRVQVVGGSYHPVDSNNYAFKIAGGKTGDRHRLLDHLFCRRR